MRRAAQQALEQTNGALAEMEAPFAAQRRCWTDRIKRNAVQA
jgi:hypothetical protein